MTLERRSFPSPNYSSRGGTKVTTIILHTAEGATTIESLGNWFANPSSQVSSHVGIDDKPNTVGEYVRREYKAWTAASANPWSIQAELCAFAKWGPSDWNAHPVMLQNTAAWIAEEAAFFGIPLTLLAPSAAQNPDHPGICQHNDLGSMGGGHWDCGPDFPIDHVLDMARGGSPEPEVHDMGPATCVDHDGQPWYFTTGTDGQIWANAGGTPDNWWSIGGGGQIDAGSGPDATLQPDGTLIVAARGKDGAVWATSRNVKDGKWTTWWSMGGK
jgi:hypothetical protein